MANLPISIERFAAYLDGNLSLDETQNIAELIMNDSSLSDLMAVNVNVDNQIKLMAENGFELPDNLAHLDFDYPNIGNTTDFTNVGEVENVLTHENYSLDSDNDTLGQNNEENSIDINDALGQNAEENSLNQEFDEFNNIGLESINSPNNNFTGEYGEQLDFNEY